MSPSHRVWEGGYSFQSLGLFEVQESTKEENEKRSKAYVHGIL